MTILRSYRLVSAFLYRMQNRSPVAEKAWNNATAEDMAEPAELDQCSVRRLNITRSRAIDLITTDSRLGSQQAEAIVAIDEAVRAAAAEDLPELCSGYSA